MKRLLAATILAGAVLAAPAWGAAVRHEDDRFGIIPEGAVVVQLESFGAPTLLPGRKLPVTTPITVFLEVPSFDDVHRVCRRSVRIRDGMLQSLHGDPVVRHKNGDHNLVEVGTRMKAVTNRVLRTKLVVNAVVISGTKSLRGGTVSKLPFSSVLGCGQIKKR